MPRIIMGISGASGIPLALQIVEQLKFTKYETHLIISSGAKRVLEYESDIPLSVLQDLADRVYACDDISAGPASGSWQHDGMIICPCSMASLANIAHGTGHNLLHRAADVSLKERRPLIIVPRETPLNRIHLKNMLLAHENGAVIMPFNPAFYNKTDNIADMMLHFCGRVFDQLGMEHDLCQRWKNNS